MAQLDDDQVGTGPEINAHTSGHCVNCDTAYAPDTRIKYVGGIDGLVESGWIGPCCYPPLGDPR